MVSLGLIFCLLTQVPRVQNGAGYRPPPLVGEADPYVRFFVSADSNAAYDHIWVRIKQISMIGAGGDRTVFSDDQGLPIDLCSLNGAFAFLGRHRVPNGVYDGVRILMTQDVSLIKHGAKEAALARFADSKFKAKYLIAEYPAPRRITEGRNCGAIFKIGDWQVDKRGVGPGKGPMIDLTDKGDFNRQAPVDFQGVVVGKAAKTSNRSFELRGQGSSVKVESDSKADFVVKPGLNLRVAGIYEVSRDALLGSSLSAVERHRKKGEIYAYVRVVGPGDGGATLGRVLRADGFLPDTTDLKIVFNGAKAPAIGAEVGLTGVLTGDTLTVGELSGVEHPKTVVPQVPQSRPPQ